MADEATTTTPAAPAEEKDEFGKAVEAVAKEVGVDAAKLEAAILDKLEKFLNYEDEEEAPAEGSAKRDMSAVAKEIRNA